MSEGNDVKKSDVTVEILKDIRQEMREVRQEIRDLREDTNARFDKANARMDALASRVVEAEVRTATAITDLAHNVHELTSYLRAQGDLRPRVERCEKDIAELQTKLRPAS